MNIINNASITIIGSGSFGTALAIAISRNGHNVVLWGRDSKYINDLKVNRRSSKFFSNILFPDSLHIESNLLVALSSSRNILLVVPSFAFSDILFQIKPLMSKGTRVCWATKGLEINTGRLLHDIAREILGDTVPLAIISGPTFAKELAMGLPSAISLASTDETFAKDLKSILHCNKNLRVYNNPDIVGVQLGGAVKNIIAIGAGISDGIGFGANARAAFITRGLIEISYLGSALGANIITFMGMSCIGDLILSCTDNQSRNRRLGIMLGNGLSVSQAKKKIGYVTEGLNSAKTIYKLSCHLGIKMPIIKEIYQILYHNKKVQDAILNLLNHSCRNEYTY